MQPDGGSLDARVLVTLLFQHAEGTRAYIARHIPRGLQTLIQVDDVLQEAWITAYEYRESFRSTGRDAFERWLRTIVSTRLANMLRAARRLKRGGGRAPMEPGRSASMTALLDRFAAPGRTPSRIVSARDAADLVLVTLSALPRDRRTAIRLRYLEGRSPGEIAEAMNRSVAAVNALLFHGCNQLRELLGSASRFLSGASRPGSSAPPRT